MESESTVHVVNVDGRDIDIVTRLHQRGYFIAKFHVFLYVNKENIEELNDQGIVSNSFIELFPITRDNPLTYEIAGHDLDNLVETARKLCFQINQPFKVRQDVRITSIESLETTPNGFEFAGIKVFTWTYDVIENDTLSICVPKPYNKDASQWLNKDVYFTLNEPCMTDKNICYARLRIFGEIVGAMGDYLFNELDLSKLVTLTKKVIKNEME